MPSSFEETRQVTVVEILNGGQTILARFTVFSRSNLFPWIGPNKCICSSAFW